MMLHMPNRPLIRPHALEALTGIMLLADGITWLLCIVLPAAATVPMAVLTRHG